MISIGHIAQANAYDSPIVTVIIQFEHLYRRTPKGRAPHNEQPCGGPGKVLRPQIAARVAA